MKNNNATTTDSAKKPASLTPLILERFQHVTVPTAEDPRLRVQGSGEDGKIKTITVNKAIYSRVLGQRSTANPNQYHMGLRQLTHVKFVLYLDEKGVANALDIIPNRMWTSGAAPTSAGRATKAGFEAHWDEELNGYDIWKENEETGEKQRIAYAGLSEKGLLEILEGLRTLRWTGNKRLAEVAGHRVERQEDDTFKIRPSRAVVYKT